MKNKLFKIISILLGVLLILGLTGCGRKASNGPTGNGDLATMMNGTVKPSELNMTRMEKYDYPYLGLSFTLPENLMKKMDDQSAAMLNDEGTDEDGSVRYGLFMWAYMTKEQIDAEVEMKGTGFFDWFDSLKRIGALGMYAADMTSEELNQLTKCDQHSEIGTSPDGKYKYYLSKNSAADPEDLKLLEEIKPSFGEVIPLPEYSSVFMPVSEGPSGKEIANIASVSTETLDGEAFTGKDFAKYELTMVNVLATWCTACVQEIPDIEKMYQEMKAKGVNVVGIVLDTVSDVDASGNVVEDQSMIDLAKRIQKVTGATYPILKPDASLLNGRLKDNYALPETFFVDKNGNIVGETYNGSHSYEEWMKITQDILETVKGK